MRGPDTQSAAGTVERTQRSSQKPSRFTRILRAMYIGVVLAGGTGVAVSPAAEKEKTGHVADDLEAAKAKKFVDAAKEIQEKKLGTVTWHHPKEHKNGQLPVKPVLLMEDLHAGPEGGNESLAHDEWLDLQILLVCQQRGLRDFRFEGVTSDRAPMPVLLPPKPGGTMSIDDVRSQLDITLFRRMHLTTHCPGENVFTMLAGNDATCRGAECPKERPKNDALFKAMLEARADVERWQQTIFTDGGYMVDHASGKLVTLKGRDIDGYETALRACRDKRKLFADAAMSPSPRDAYAVGLDPDVLKFGAFHAEEMIRLFTKNGRSVGAIVNSSASTVKETAKKAEADVLPDLEKTLRGIQGMRDEREKNIRP